MSLLDFIKSKGITPTELSVRLNTGIQSIYKWSYKQARPKYTNIVKLCRELEVSKDGLEKYIKPEEIK